MLTPCKRKRGTQGNPAKENKKLFWVLPKILRVLPCLKPGTRLHFPFSYLLFPLPFKLALSILLRCAKDSAHTCRVSHTNFATCELPRPTIPLPYTPLHLAVERIHAWGAPGGVFVHFNLVVTCPFWRQLQKWFSWSDFTPRSSNFVQMKERVELFRLQAIRGSEVAFMLQESHGVWGLNRTGRTFVFCGFCSKIAIFTAVFWWNLTKIGPNSSLSCPLSIAHTHTHTHSHTHTHTYTHTHTHTRTNIRDRQGEG